MKKKIGNLEGYAIIEGDKNLLETNHEIHIDDLKGNNNSGSSSDKQYKIITEADIESITYNRHSNMSIEILDIYIKLKDSAIDEMSCNYTTFENYNNHVIASSYLDKNNNSSVENFISGLIHLEFNVDNFTKAEGGTIFISSEDNSHSSQLDCETKKLILLFDQK